VRKQRRPCHVLIHIVADASRRIYLVVKYDNTRAEGRALAEIEVFIRGRRQAEQDPERLPNDSHALELLDIGTKFELKLSSCDELEALGYYCQHVIAAEEHSLKNVGFSLAFTHSDNSALFHALSVFSSSSPLSQIIESSGAVSASATEVYDFSLLTVAMPDLFQL
jgi:hypothetical protein